jgi:hypothetical protein
MIKNWRWKNDFFKKNFFTESKENTLGEEFLRRESVGWLSANINFYSRQRDLRREHEIKLSPKNIALGEVSVSRSESNL